VDEGCDAANEEPRSTVQQPCRHKGSHRITESVSETTPRLRSDTAGLMSTSPNWNDVSLSGDVGLYQRTSLLSALSCNQFDLIQLVTASMHSVIVNDSLQMSDGLQEP
jgi:hypothetical protein